MKNLDVVPGKTIRDTMTDDCPRCGRQLYWNPQTKKYRCKKCNSHAWGPADGTDKD